MKLNKKNAILLSLALLSGCETYYHVPNESPTAKVRFKSTGQLQTVMVSAFEDEQCKFGSWGGVMGVMGGVAVDPLNNVPQKIKESGNTEEIIGYENNYPVAPIERPVPADRKFVFTLFRIDAYSSTQHVKTCKISMAFHPKPGLQYEVEYAEDNSKCYANIYILDQMESEKIIKTIEPSAHKTKEEC
jgi:hypothetical protein